MKGLGWEVIFNYSEKFKARLLWMFNMNPKSQCPRERNIIDCHVLCDLVLEACLGQLGNEETLDTQIHIQKSWGQVDCAHYDGVAPTMQQPRIPAR